MAFDRTYPRDDSEYPEIMSKMDPLIIRVSPTVLMVGSTTYTAKVKMGNKFTGFFVYVSSVGLPIYKQEVDTSGYSNNTSTTGEGSDAWNYIQDMARDWMDTLEQSMLTDSKEKNIIDLLREIKFQMHFDLSGHKEQAEQYGPNLEICTEVPVYIQSILNQLISLNSKLDTLNDALNGENGLNNRITAIEEQVTSVKNSIDDLNTGVSQELSDIDNTLSNDVCTTIQNGYEAVAHAVEVQTGKINNLNQDLNDVATVIGSVKTSGGSYDTSNNTLCGRVNDLIINYIGTDSSGKLWSDVKSIESSVGSAGGDISSLIGTVNSIANKPILTMDSSHVTWLNYWVADVYDSNGSHYWVENFTHLLEDALQDGMVGAYTDTNSTTFDTWWADGWGLRVNVGQVQ